VEHADLFVAATGVRPHVEFLAGTPVAVGWGVQVDEYMGTPIKDVYAAGDVAEAADLLSGERYVHAIFPNAVAQGRVAAANALGSKVRYEGAESMNSLKHLGVPVVAIGTIQGADEVVKGGTKGSVRSLYLKDNRIIGVQLALDTSAAGLYRSLMLRRVNVRRIFERYRAPISLPLTPFSPGPRFLTPPLQPGRHLDLGSQLIGGEPVSEPVGAPTPDRNRLIPPSARKSPGDRVLSNLGLDHSAPREDLYNRRRDDGCHRLFVRLYACVLRLHFHS
jgi:hypothetical protein